MTRLHKKIKDNNNKKKSHSITGTVPPTDG